LSTFETVGAETPACSAITAIVVAWPGERGRLGIVALTRAV
jgi:hypothetical protein